MVAILRRSGDRVTEDARLIQVGHIAGPHGIKGEVLIKSYTGNPEDIGSYGPLETQTGDAIRIARCRTSSKGVVASLKGVSGRNAAEALKGTKLFIARDRLPVPDDDEWYIADLIGLDVRDVDGAAIGRIVTVHDFGAGELLEVELVAQAQTVLLPFLTETVPDVRIADGFVTVAIPAELLSGHDARDAADGGEDDSGNDGAGGDEVPTS